jgi:MOSC domain-containing protein YiiM
MTAAFTVVGLYRSAGHNFFGHYGRAAGVEPMEAIDAAQIDAGRGIVGDRFHRGKPDKAGQVTFFAEETWLRLSEALGQRDRGPAVFRRNILVRGADLNALVGVAFTIQGVQFAGAEYCKPCFWMDQAFAPGTLRLLREWNAGGLRARALSSGTIVRSLGTPGCVLQPHLSQP